MIINQFAKEDKIVKKYQQLKAFVTSVSDAYDELEEDLNEVKETKQLVSDKISAGVTASVLLENTAILEKRVKTLQMKYEELIGIEKSRTAD